MRSIEPSMIAYIDKKLAENGTAQHAIEIKDARLLMIEAAKSCVGIREKGGNNKGPMVELMQRTIGSADQEPWCMSFVQTCVAYSEIKTGIKSRLYPTEHCMTAWVNSAELKIRFFPLPGAIIIWKHGNTQNGHTGFFLEADEKGGMKAVEGNTESGIVGGVVERDGGGVYLTKRGFAGDGNMRVVGFLKPF